MPNGRDTENDDHRPSKDVDSSYEDMVKLPSTVLDAIHTISVPHLDGFEAIQDSISAITEQYAKNLKGLFSSVEQVTLTMGLRFDYLDRFRESVLSSLAPMMEQLAKIGVSLDWERILEDSRCWGSYGWAITNDQFTANSLPCCPSTLREADPICLSFVDVDSIVADLEVNIAKRKDLREAVELFHERRYKPCAMMLCSLIDRELYRVCCSPRRNADLGLGGHRAWTGRLKALNGLLAGNDGSVIPATALSVIDFVNIFEAVNYFFRQGDDFNRGLEGELNRNFLDHGMMYKPVRRKTCVKLFVLLDAVSSALPTALGFVSSRAEGRSG